MIQVHISMTGKGYHPSSEWRRFADDTRTFPDMATAKAWLKEQYGKCKRVPMFRDTAEGTKRIGYVYSFRADDISHVPVEKWLQQDWVSFYEGKEVAP